ncbi:hypothetical protein Tco_1540566 [Tanacetum coccineum]
MTKVINGEFEKLKAIKIKDVSLACDTSLEIFNEEFNQMGGMDDDLFTREVEIANIPCDLNEYDDSEQQMSHEADDMGWREDGYCNTGNLPGAYIVRNSLHYRDLEWYDTLIDSELKDEALRNKAIMEGLISDDEFAMMVGENGKAMRLTTTIKMKENMGMKLMMKDMSYVDEWEVDRYGNAKLVILEYLVKISKKARVLELKRRYFEDYCSNTQYAVSIKKIRCICDCTSLKTMKETRSIRHILILAVQNRLFNLKGDVIVHLAAALCMFTRRIVNPEESGRSSTWCRKLPEEAQHLKTNDAQGWNH